jgi:hypothetical protein
MLFLWIYLVFLAAVLSGWVFYMLGERDGKRSEREAPPKARVALAARIAEAEEELVEFQRFVADIEEELAELRAEVAPAVEAKR